MFPLLLQDPNWHWKLFGKRWAPTSNAADANEEEGGAYVGVGVGVSAYDGRFSLLLSSSLRCCSEGGRERGVEEGGDRLLERPNPCERSGMGFTNFWVFHPFACECHKMNYWRVPKQKNPYNWSKLDANSEKKVFVSDRFGAIELTKVNIFSSFILIVFVTLYCIYCFSLAGESLAKIERA